MMTGELNPFGRDVFHEVNHAVAITPFVVIPAHDFEEAFFALQIVLQRREAVVDGAAIVVDKVGGNQFFIGHAEDVLEIRLGRVLQRGVNLFNARVLRGADGEVNHGNVRRWNPEGHAGKLAFGDGQHFADSLRRTSGARNDVDARRATAAPVFLGRAVYGFLRGRHRVNRGHQTGFDAKAVLDENVHERREAVRGAGRVGNNVVLGCVVFAFIDAHDDGFNITFAGGGNDDFLRASGDVGLCLFAVGEETGGFDHDVYSKCFPWQGREVFHRADAFDLVTVDHDHV